MFEFATVVFNDPIGRWVIYVAIFVFAVVAGLRLWVVIRDRLDELTRNLGVVKEQVANNHVKPDGTPINMREESDDRHTETSDKLDLVVTLVKGQGESIAALQSGQRSLYSLILANTTDIEALQNISDTKTRAEINRIIGDNHDGKHAQPYPGDGLEDRAV